MSAFPPGAPAARLADTGGAGSPRGFLLSDHPIPDPIPPPTGRQQPSGRRARRAGRLAGSGEGSEEDKAGWRGGWLPGGCAWPEQPARILPPSTPSPSHQHSPASCPSPSIAGRGAARVAAGRLASRVRGEGQEGRAVAAGGGVDAAKRLVRGEGGGFEGTIAGSLTAQCVLNCAARKTFQENVVRGVACPDRTDPRIGEVSSAEK